MPSLLRTLAAATCAAALLPSTARAHEREYTLSRDWFLPYQGEHELESRTFWNTHTGDFTQVIELEYGVTEWFAIEPGIEFVHNDKEELEAEGLEIEFRFHWLEFAYEKFLPALNIELEQPLEDKDGEETRGELKGVLSWYGEDGHDFTFNLNVGTTLTGDRENESEATFGYVQPLEELADDEPAGWHRHPRIGFEGIYDFEEDHLGLGPLFVYRGTEHLNMLVAYIFGIDERDENHDELRLIFEWEF